MLAPDGLSAPPRHGRPDLPGRRSAPLGPGPGPRARGPLPGGRPQRLSPLLPRRKPRRLRQQSGGPQPRRRLRSGPAQDRLDRPERRPRQRPALVGRRNADRLRPPPGPDVRRGAPSANSAPAGPSISPSGLADAATGKARELWRTPKDAPRFHTFRNFELAANGRILFTAERRGMEPRLLDALDGRRARGHHARRRLRRTPRALDRRTRPSSSRATWATSTAGGSGRSGRPAASPRRSRRRTRSGRCPSPCRRARGRPSSTPRPRTRRRSRRSRPPEERSRSWRRASSRPNSRPASS